MIRWKSLGRILHPGNEKVDWLNTHAGAACVRNLSGNHLNALVSGRNASNYSVLGEVVIELEPFPRVIEIIETPTFLPGEIGCFDDCGVSYPWIVHTENEEKLYYTGWMKGIQTPFQNALGLAYRKGSRYERISRAPLLPRTNEEPFSSGSMCVLREKNNWQMWYTSFDSWYKSNNGIEPRYHIRSAISVDGIQWQRSNKKAIFSSTYSDGCIARPSVIKTSKSYEMYYCYRGKNYKLGMSISDDGQTWRRIDKEFQFVNSGERWDNAMNCYPCNFKHKGTEYMLYCGNEYGKGGLGIAVKETE